MLKHIKKLGLPAERSGGTVGAAVNSYVCWTRRHFLRLRLSPHLLFIISSVSKCVASEQQFEMFKTNLPLVLFILHTAGAHW